MNEQIGPINGTKLSRNDKVIVSEIMMTLYADELMLVSSP